MKEPAVYLPPERLIERIEEPETFTSKEVMAMTGVSYRQLDYWIRCRYIEGQPEFLGSGRQRKWTKADVERVVEIRDAIEQALRILATVGVGTGAWGKLVAR